MSNGEHCIVKVPLRERDVRVAVWRVDVGRVSLYLMDANVEGNDPWDRELTARLYGGDREHRIEQEMILGIGGVRVLRAMGFNPAVWHANEGHAAFMMLERIREQVEQGLSFQKAAEMIRDTTIFTTHTPVPAGNDSFPLHLIGKHFRHYWGLLGLTEEEFLALAAHREEWGTGFNMTVLSLRLAGQANGVSALHGEVSRQMWQPLWPARSVEQVPIQSVTNGVHVPTWIAPEMNLLFNKYLGPDWMKRHDDPGMWELIMEIPDEQLWAVHQQLKRKLLSFMRDRSRQKWMQGLLSPEQVVATGALLDANVLTIGFARRFATYKRAHLIFRELARCRDLLLDPARPVQIVFAGKAHPADEGGQRLIQFVYSLAKDHGFGGNVAFVEDYDMHVARYLVNGVDVWLNNPRRPQEASGTSGQKAALNGVPHFSILDGWWAEGYDGSNGWAIGENEHSPVEILQDEIDAQSLYRLLEQQVVPLYYDRDRDHVPRGWVRMMKQAIRTCAPKFSARRMVKEYAERFYAPAARVAASLAKK
jgi:starch phosphorylase